MLLGTYAAKLAANHRTAVPAPLRHDLKEKIIIAKWYEECLVILTEGSLNALLTRITGNENLITGPVRGSEHFIFSSAYEIEIDDQGRIVIPDSLVAYAGLGEEIYFLGVGDRIELWNKNTWDEKDKLVTKEAPKYIEELSNQNGKRK